MTKRSHQRYWARDLVDVSNPSNVHSFGLELQDETADALIVAPLAGVEWQITDRWTIAVTPRLELMLGGANRAALMVPVSLGYSWYVAGAPDAPATASRFGHGWATRAATAAPSEGAGARARVTRKGGKDHVEAHRVVEEER